MKMIIHMLIILFLWNNSLHALKSSGITAVSLQDMLKWGRPKTLPPGAEDHVLSGNPETKGIYVVRLKLPAHYKIPPYYQSKTTYTTVISGSYYVGTGNQFDEAKGTSISQGGFIIIPKNIPVYAWTTEPTIIQIHGEGPLKVTRVK